MTRFATLACLGALAGGSGCASNQQLNPSFPLSSTQAGEAWREMEQQPVRLERPVLVLGGIYDPGLMSGNVAREIRQIASDDSQVIPFSFVIEGSFDSCSRKLIAAVEERFPSDEDDQTVEVDVIGFSMGGLVARHAASQMGLQAAGKRLRIARLFTIGTPHRGANLAAIPTFDKRVLDMRKESQFLAKLNDEERPYEVVPYVRLGDLVIGAENAAPPGQTPFWLNRTFFGSHALAGCDRRILADIARRLRQERPFTCPPATPLPGGSAATAPPPPEPPISPTGPMMVAFPYSPHQTAAC